MMWKKKMKQNNQPGLKKIATLTGHVAGIFDVAAYGNSIYTSSADHFIVQWDLSKQQQTDFVIKLERSAYNFSIAPLREEMVIGSSNGELHLIDLKNRKEIKIVQHHKYPIFSVTYNQQFDQYYTGDKEGNFCVWSGTDLSLLLTFPYDCGKIRQITLNEDESMLAICGQDGYVRLLDTSFFNLQHQFKANEEGVNCALFDENLLYTGGKDAFINLWDWKKERKLKSVPAHNFPIYDMAWLDHKTKLVSASFDKSIKLWHPADISIIQRIEYKDGGHQHTVNRIAKISETSIATVSDDRRILVWELT